MTPASSAPLESSPPQELRLVKSSFRAQSRPHPLSLVRGFQTQRGAGERRWGEAGAVRDNEGWGWTEGRLAGRYMSLASVSGSSTLSWRVKVVKSPYRTFTWIVCASLGDAA
mgnify:CR=1 FL=1